MNTWANWPYREWAFEYLLPAIAFGLLVMLFLGDTLSGNWRADDGAHLKYAVTYSPWQYFFDPVVTRGQSGAHVTPWNVFFYDIGLALWQFNPAGHYAHMLIVIGTTAMALYRVLRIWLPRVHSLFGATAFLAGKPTLYVAHYLMTGHYATGALFALLSILAWNHALTSGRRRHLALTAFFYLLATTCKEVYVPLPLLLIFIPVGSLPQRLRQIWPMACVAVFYIAWRHAVLGHFLGGYNPGGTGLSLSLVQEQFSAIPRLLVGSGAAGAIQLLISLALLAGAAWARRLRYPLILACAAVTLLPLAPLTVFPGIHLPDRYLFVLWIVVAAGLATLLPRSSGLRHGIAAFAIGVVLLVAMTVENRREHDAMAPDLARQDAYYRFALGMDKPRQGLYIPEDDGYWSMVLSAIRHARDRHAGLDDAGDVTEPSVINDRPVSIGMLSPADVDGKQYFGYVEGKIQAVDIRDRHRFVLQGLASGKDKPLSISFDYLNGALYWRFGPYPGNYLLSADGIGTVRLAANGSYPWTLDRLLHMRICHESPEGWSTCSPWLTMLPKDRPEFRWEQRNDPPAATNLNSPGKPPTRPQH
jgi:hypothetical protein